MKKPDDYECIRCQEVFKSHAPEPFCVYCRQELAAPHAPKPEKSKR